MSGKKSTREQSMRKVEGLINHFETIEQVAISLGLLYQEANSPVSPAMLLLSENSQVMIAILKKLLLEM